MVLFVSKNSMSGLWSRLCHRLGEELDSYPQSSTWAGGILASAGFIDKPVTWLMEENPDVLGLRVSQVAELCVNETGRPGCNVEWALAHVLWSLGKGSRAHGLPQQLRLGPVFWKVGQRPLSKETLTGGALGPAGMHWGPSFPLCIFHDEAVLPSAQVL